MYLNIKLKTIVKKEKSSFLLRGLFEGRYVDSFVLIIFEWSRLGGFFVRFFIFSFCVWSKRVAVVSRFRGFLGLG